MFQVQVKVFVTPPGMTVPAVAGGEDATFAEAVPIAVTVGSGSASSTTSAWPVFCAESTSCTCCRPAETWLGLALAESESAPGCCTETGEEVTGAGASAPCVFASTPEAEPVKVSVPLPDTM